jgi:hypothetical protein
MKKKRRKPEPGPIPTCLGLTTSLAGPTSFFLSVVPRRLLACGPRCCQLLARNEHGRSQYREWLGGRFHPPGSRVPVRTLRWPQTVGPGWQVLLSSSHNSSRMVATEYRNSGRIRHPLVNI